MPGPAAGVFWGALGGARDLYRRLREGMRDSDFYKNVKREHERRRAAADNPYVRAAVDKQYRDIGKDAANKVNRARDWVRDRAAEAGWRMDGGRQAMVPYVASGGGRGPGDWDGKGFGLGNRHWAEYMPDRQVAPLETALGAGTLGMGVGYMVDDDETNRLEALYRMERERGYDKSFDEFVDEFLGDR